MNNQTQRPRIKLQPSIADHILTFAGWCAIIATWVFVLTNYSQLPLIIPTHYNAGGEIDGYGNKTMIFILPVFATIAFAGLTILNRRPHIFNYPVTITEENAARQYKNATRAINFLKTVVVVIFGSVAFESIQVAKRQSGPFGAWFLPMTLALIFIPLIFFAARSIYNK